jgi:hypothetical protein
LRLIDDQAFADSSLRSICIPASVHEIIGSAFEGHTVSANAITFDGGNPSFAVSGDFLVDALGTRIIRYFGVAITVTVNRNIEILSRGCFSACISVLSFLFESGSNLIRIESHAFRSCTSLQSICIPASVEILCEECFVGCPLLLRLTFESGSKLQRIERKFLLDCLSITSLSLPPSIIALEKDWASESGLRSLVFESGASLANMIESGEVDLSGDLEILIDAADRHLDYLDYSVEEFFDDLRFVQLVRS